MSNTERPYVVHLVTKVLDSNGGKVREPGTWAATVVFTHDQDRKISAGVALCDPRDPFSGKFGVKIATGRAKDQGVYAWPAIINPDILKLPHIPYGVYVIWAKEVVSWFVNNKIDPLKHDKIYKDLGLPSYLRNNDYEESMTQDENYVLSQIG